MLTPSQQRSRHGKTRLYIACTYWLLSVAAWASATIPEYRIEEAPLHIQKAAAARCSPREILKLDHLILEPHAHTEATGRSNRLLDSDELKNLKVTLPPAFPHSAQTDPEGIFVLWRIAEAEYESTTENAAVLAFDLTVDTARTVYLGLGADHKAVVVLNGQAQFARAGYDYHLVCNNIVPLDLDKGRNRVSVVTICTDRRAAARYFSPTWELSLNVFPDLNSALTAHDLKNHHFLDTPVVNRLDDIRCINGFPVYKQVRFLNGDGKELTSGSVKSNGNIAWTQSIAEDVHYGILEIDGVRSEPVLLFASQDIDRELEKDLPGVDKSAWSYRARHLLKKDFVSHRGGESRWARKLAVAVHHARSTAWSKQAHSSFKFGNFASAIDGTPQYYAYYLPDAAIRNPEKTFPVVVVLPAVQSTIRPFLESPILAGSEQMEQWCSVADETDVVLLWPGYIDVDYGGPITQRALQEVLSHFYREHRQAGSLNLLGACSAGVTALEYVKNNPHSVTGLILHSPVLSKRSRRFTPGMFGQPVPSPFAPLSTEQLMGDFEVQRCALLFDLGMPGHGEPSAVPQFLEFAAKQKIPIDHLGNEQSEEYIWGERLNWRLRKMFQWAHQSPQNAPRVGPVPLDTSSTSVQSLLLRGFAIRTIDEPQLDDWAQWWTTQQTKWRGGAPSAANSNGKTLLTIKTEPCNLLLSRFSLPAASGVKPGPDRLFAVYADPSAGEVVVSRTPSTSAPHPKVDLLIDGNFKSAIWEQNQAGNWKLLSIVH